MVYYLPRTALRALAPAMSLLGLLAPGAGAQAPTPAPLTPAKILADAPPGAWRKVAPENLLMMTLAGGGRVAIELAPEFAPAHVANIVRLARAGWFDGTSINRAQDNYVVQWGDATEAKPLPAAIVANPPAEYERPAAGLAFDALPYRDAYAPRIGFVAGQPAAAEGNIAWLAHCYGMVGVGRSNAPDTGTGAELYAVIGHGPRHLDRNIALVGRVIDNMGDLAARRRGTAALGFYADPAEREAIVSVRLAADLPAAERPAYEVLGTDRPAFAAWVKARANRKDDFFIRPAGAVDLCNALPPVRKAGG
ncbi:peptidylprolyl isomerase [Sphingomonas oleivorans]|uniref:peptidylprolyl isomerase n=1 Tax=Sphingomonas oleivorans TaxID=1735121 RepID=A0A2T5G1T3_9SPHN|nr:peptidylprolyl isomerase [Sphingomonas oleivorans]PTQ13105.1 peptidylprolyl isomerase [Sphingomonas oleivorans]